MGMHAQMTGQDLQGDCSHPSDGSEQGGIQEREGSGGDHTAQDQPVLAMSLGCR